MMASQVLVPSLFHKPVLQNDTASMFLRLTSLVSLLPSNKHSFCLNYIKLFLYYLQPTNPNYHPKYLGLCMCVPTFVFKRKRVLTAVWKMDSPALIIFHLVHSNNLISQLLHSLSWLYSILHVAAWEIYLKCTSALVSLLILSVTCKIEAKLISGTYKPIHPSNKDNENLLCTYCSGH